MCENTIWCKPRGLPYQLRNVPREAKQQKTKMLISRRCRRGKCLKEKLLRTFARGTRYGAVKKLIPPDAKRWSRERGNTRHTIFGYEAESHGGWQLRSQEEHELECIRWRVSTGPKLLHAQICVMDSFDTLFSARKKFNEEKRADSVSTTSNALLPNTFTIIKCCAENNVQYRNGRLL